MSIVDALLGFCSHTWYGLGGVLIDGCPEGGAHLCGEDAGHAAPHRCQDCAAVDPELEVPC